MSPQDKLMVVANRLGLSTLKDMQGSTGAIYDADLIGNGEVFTNCSQHANPAATNLNDNRFEVNEALLIESISLYDSRGGLTFQNWFSKYGTGAIVTADVIIGNKRVVKEQPFWNFGCVNDNAFSSVKQADAGIALAPRHTIFMEGAGIVIPPQVEFSVKLTAYDMATQEAISTTDLGVMLYGTKVNLNFNTSL